MSGITEDARFQKYDTAIRTLFHDHFGKNHVPIKKAEFVKKYKLTGHVFDAMEKLNMVDGKGSRKYSMKVLIDPKDLEPKRIRELLDKMSEMKRDDSENNKRVNDFAIRVELSDEEIRAIKLLKGRGYSIHKTVTQEIEL